MTLSSLGGVATAHVVGSPYAITPSAASGGSFSASDYALTYVVGALTVSPLALLGSITVADKPYDATTAAIITGRTLTGILGGDQLSYTVSVQPYLVDK